MARIVGKITDLLEYRVDNPVIPSRAGDLFRNIVVNYHDNANDAIVLLILSLLDFKSEVCMTDDLSNEDSRETSSRSMQSLLPCWKMGVLLNKFLLVIKWIYVKQLKHGKSVVKQRQLPETIVKSQIKP
ncbi:hypothetical protein EVAR_84044_1 [Eumeta japonica]|uniref:Uncharacterized protein n=1 Tax=Eumeta variegata TaxID=151549 RepID=A0A4C2AA18_EUMVA|nr:hypothetical protein EVAR_84044_1 [Eumeta japonica]